MFINNYKISYNRYTNNMQQKKSNMFIDPEILRGAILDKFGSQVEFARKMGLSEPKVSRGLKKQSSKFMAIMRKAEINISSLKNEEDYKKHGKEGLRIIELEKRVSELEELLEKQNEIIKSYKTIFKNQFKDSN